MSRTIARKGVPFRTRHFAVSKPPIRCYPSTISSFPPSSCRSIQKSRRVSVCKAVCHGHTEHILTIMGESLVKTSRMLEAYLPNNKYLPRVSTFGLPNPWRTKVTEKKYRCGLEAALDVVGGKWKVLILWHLSEIRRFGELRRWSLALAKKCLFNNCAS